MYTVFVTDLYADDPSSKTTSYQIPKDSVTIGRSHDNDITIRQTNVSSKHATITRTDQGFFLKDLNSTNGTMVNKTPLQGSIRIFSDDQIEIGGAIIRVTGHPDLERGNVDSSRGDDLQDLAKSQHKAGLDELFGPGGDIPSGPKSEPPLGEDFSLSKIAADPFGSSRLSVSLDSLIPSNDDMYKPNQGASPSDPFPMMDDFGSGKDPYPSRAGNRDLLDKINALESRMITDKSGKGGKPAAAEGGMNSKTPERRRAESIKPVPPPEDDLFPPEEPGNERDALFAPFPDAGNDVFADGREDLDSGAITINILDPVPSGMNRTMRFPARPITVGRDVGCDICIADSFVSGRHASIELESGRLRLRDLGSRNGSFVNNRKIETVQVLNPQDVVSLGRFRFNASVSKGGALPKGTSKPRKALETAFDQKSPFDTGSPARQPQREQVVRKERFPGMDEPYEKVLAGNLVGIALQIHLAKTAIGKALEDLQARPVDRGEIRNICRPLSTAIRVLYKVGQAEMSESNLNELVDSVIENCTQTLELIGGSEYFSLARREVIKAHSILFPLSSEGCSFFETTGASVGLSLLSEIGFQGVQRKEACTTLTCEGEDLKGVTIAASKIGASLSRLAYVRALAKYVADILFFDDLESLKLMNLVDEACTNAIEHGFTLDEQEYLRLSFVLLLDDRLAVVVDDKGIPFDTEKAEAGELDGLGIRLMRAFSEEVHFQNMGRRGKRVLMILPANARSSEVFLSHMPKAEIGGRSAVEMQNVVETLHAGQADEISKCVYRTYRYDYFDDLLYRPSELQSLLDQGRMISAGALTEKGDMVGYMSVSLEEPDAQTGLLEHMVIEPSLNSANMASKLTTYLVGVCREKGMTGLLVDMTTSHPYEQVVYNSLGAKMTGIMLGHFPADHERIDLLGEFSWKSRRESSVTAFLQLEHSDGQQVFLPRKYFDILQTIYEKLDLNRKIIPPSGSQGPMLPAISNIVVNVSNSLGIATIKVWEIGDDINDIIEAKFLEFNNEPISAVYLDLPLTGPAISSIVERLETFHFCFSCLLPEDRYGDMLRLQVVKTNVDVGNLHIEENFGKAILERIEEERNRYR